MVDTMVVTYNGANELKSDCAFIRGKYYHKTKDCFLYDGIYYSPFSRYLVLDNETNERVHSSSRELSFGILRIENGKYILGHYSSNIAKNGSIYLSTKLDQSSFKSIMEEVSVNNDGVMLRSEELTMADRLRRNSRLLMNDASDLSERLGITEPEIDPSIRKERLVKCMDIESFGKEWIQSKNSDILCLPEDIPVYNKAYNPKFSSVSAQNQYEFNLAYNSEVMMNVFQAAYNNHVPVASGVPLSITKYLGTKTFGVEYESWDGRLPTYIAAKNGLIPVRDGSLRHDGICGFEYASVIMNGAKGLMAIKEQCNVLKQYTVFNEKCSVHIHVGSIPRTAENLVRLYQAFHTIQDSIYSMFPSCLQNTGVYKQKDYCSRLPNLAENVNDIVKWLSDGKELFKEFGRHHPKDSTMQSKWNCASRYSIVNFNNFYYTERGTVELRVSTPTFNHNKVSALLILMSLIIDSALSGEKLFDNVINLVNAKMSGPERVWMIGYINHRQTVLNQWAPNKDGIKYYETMKNDNETGNGEELY
jgi:hypothetical protein